MSALLDNNLDRSAEPVSLFMILVIECIHTYPYSYSYWYSHDDVHITCKIRRSCHIYLLQHRLAHMSVNLGLGMQKTDTSEYYTNPALQLVHMSSQH